MFGCSGRSGARQDDEAYKCTVDTMQSVLWRGSRNTSGYCASPIFACQHVDCVLQQGLQLDRMLLMKLLSMPCSKLARLALILCPSILVHRQLTPQLTVPEWLPERCAVRSVHVTAMQYMPRHLVTPVRPEISSPSDVWSTPPPSLWTLPGQSPHTPSWNIFALILSAVFLKHRWSTTQSFTGRMVSGARFSVSCFEETSDHNRITQNFLRIRQRLCGD